MSALRPAFPLAYVGSRTTRERHARGDGISVYQVDPAGALTLIQVVDGLTNPSFLALNKRKDRLYTVHGDGNEVSVFKVSPEDGKLEFLQCQTCGGRNPVHLALDPTERWLLVSDHLGIEGGGAMLVLPVRDDGTLGSVSQRVEMTGKPGPHRKEQPHAKPHFNPFDPSGQFVVVPDKGLDRIFIFRFDNGALLPATTPWVDSRAGAGPRHLAFHPGAPFAYVANELDSTVVAYRFDAANGMLSPFQVLSTLPDTYTGNNTSSEIEISADGATLYVSNRGDDSIAVYSVDASSGKMLFREAVSSRGRTPRFFTQGLDGSVLFVLNEDSDSIVTFPVMDDGALGAPTSEIRCGSPVCLIM